MVRSLQHKLDTYAKEVSFLIVPRMPRLLYLPHSIKQQLLLSPAHSFSGLDSPSPFHIPLSSVLFHNNKKKFFTLLK